MDHFAFMSTTENRTVTIRDSYYILHNDQCMASLGAATIVFTRAQMVDTGSLKLPCRIATELHSSTNMAYPILPECNLDSKAPRDVQPMTDFLLTKVEWKFALVYLYDIIIFLQRLTNTSSIFDKF